MIYKRVESVRGPRYYGKENGGRPLLISAMTIPQRVMDTLQVAPLGEWFDEDAPQQAPAGQTQVSLSRVCVLCLQPASKRKYVNGQIVYICDDDYHTKTVGEIAHKLRELVHEETKEV
jgi:hypothetical protein